MKTKTPKKMTKNFIRLQRTLFSLSLPYALLGLAFAGQAHAQQTGAEEPTQAEEMRLPMVTVTSETEAEGASQGYKAKDSALAGFGDQPLLDTPFSVKVAPWELFFNQSFNDIGAMDRLDASVTSSAVNPGAFTNLAIRGLNLNNFNNYRYNGLRIINQQATGLENVESSPNSFSKFVLNFPNELVGSTSLSPSGLRLKLKRKRLTLGCISQPQALRSKAMNYGATQERMPRLNDPSNIGERTLTFRVAKANE
ncbi:hypothetical protein Nhal_1801 [Nitrosococcus halophilus Nc 4]|uniref:Uncharacterized protein n=1 Tax=Nitrosococcus halophilus (strain Nc4) TaxID=472759 RepID=D5C330_NITHN|nr:hypothetical protein [Nitrosococcus halophilus]ADE14922.1 hypothetical protein Nhal_1801 [Nitrosococcus halophilus Nc 4]